MKKINIGILSMALVAGLGLVSCGSSQDNSGNNNNNNQQQEETKKEMGSVIKSKQDVYAYSMFSSSTLVSNLSPMTASLAALTEEEKQAEINKIDEYVNMFEGLLSSKGINQTTEKNTDEEFKEYETKMTVVQSGKTYVSYMNETAKNEEDKDKEDDEEVEIETLIEGLMFELDEDNNKVASYLIEGSKEISKEVEESEAEEELEIKMTSYLAEQVEANKYEKVKDAKTVTVKQEFETETKEDGTVEKEQSFKYTVKDKDGKKIDAECSKVEIEEENGETEIKLQVGASKETAKIYKFTKESDLLKVKVFEGKENLVEEIIITTITDAEGNVTYSYEFKDVNNKEENKENEKVEEDKKDEETK